MFVYDDSISFAILSLISSLAKFFTCAMKKMNLRTLEDEVMGLSLLSFSISLFLSFFSFFFSLSD